MLQVICKLFKYLMMEKKACKEEKVAEEEVLLEEREQAYDKIKTKIEILDVAFHPTENNLITLCCINGKLKM